MLSWENKGLSQRAQSEELWNIHAKMNIFFSGCLQTLVETDYVQTFSLLCGFLLYVNTSKSRIVFKASNSSVGRTFDLQNYGRTWFDSWLSSGGECLISLYQPIRGLTKSCRLRIIFFGNLGVVQG